MKNKWIWVGTLIVIVFLSLILQLKIVNLADDIFEKAAAVFTTLFLLALFIERALDVFLTTMRAGESENKQIEISILEEELKIDATKLEVLNQKKNELLNYKAKTRVIALWSALTLGIIISSVGYRALQSLVDPTDFTAIKNYQQIVFFIIDIFITGCVLAGGSDAIHKMMDAFRLFMEKKKE